MAKTAKKDAVKKIEKVVPVKKVVPVEPVVEIEPEPEPEKVEAETEKPRKLAGIGIIAVIIETLKKGWTTKAAIHEILVAKFPDRPAAGMKSTVGIQCSPGRLGQKYKLVKDGDKYRIEG